MYWIKNNTDYVIGAVQPENSIQVSKRPTSAHSWNGTKWVFDGFSAEKSMAKLRSQRNTKLLETDWEIIKALETETDATSLKEYRQALRDLPANCTPALDENGNLTGVTWPEKPSS